MDEARLEESYSLLSSDKCPMCRTDLPKSEKDRFSLVEKNVQEHPDWIWPLYKIGKYYEIGCGCSKDLKKAFTYYKKGAECGDTKSQHELGNCFNHAKGVSKAIPDAIHWYTQAAKQGFALSQYALGEIYYDQKKFKEACRWYSLAAEQGLDMAQCSLAFCYENGDGVERSLEKSLYWNKKAAEQGNTTAMANYGGNLLTRAAMKSGGRVDLVGKSAVPEALYWARKSMSLGYDDARSLVSQIEAAVLNTCANCEVKVGANPKIFSRCSQCKAASYCSKECQVTHWKKGHKWDCVDKDGVKKVREGK